MVLRTYLVYNTVVRLCQFFCCGGKILLQLKKKFLSSVWRVVLLCQFLVLAGNRFWLYILLCTWSTIQLWCCVIFFWFWREIVFVLRTYLVYNTVVRLCQFFCYGGKVVLRPEKKDLVVCLVGCGVVQAWVGQKHPKSNILRRFFYRSYAS